MVFNWLLSAQVKGEIEKTYNLQIHQNVICKKGNTAVVIDEKTKKICLANRNSETHLIEKFFLSFNDILSSEIVEDGSSITKTDRASQIGGAAVGGVLLGPVGMLIGGLSGSTSTTNKASYITLLITVNSTKQPTFEVCFLDKTVDKTGWLAHEYNESIKEARKWHGIFDVIISRSNAEIKANPESFYIYKNDRQHGPHSTDVLKQQLQNGALTPDDYVCNDGKNWVRIAEHPKLSQSAKKELPNNETKNFEHSVADEIAKLAELKSQGHLTDEEFLNLKSKLISEL